jgi:6-phosphogluconolactonase (cycloisomerase 2 family)
VLSENGRFLFAVNAGSNDVSVFAAREDDLRLVGRVPSGGVRPISITVDHDLVYVLNAGGAGNIAGFSGARDGRLTPSPGSIQPLSAGGAGPAQIQFTENGRVLAVTEKTANTIVTYTVDRDGVAGQPRAFASAGAVPFGFAVDGRGRLFVSEASASSLSSYDVNRAGDLTRISAAVANGQRAACWAVVTENGRFVYTANAGNGTISGYRVYADGAVSLLDATGVTATTGGNPTDTALSTGSHYLYTLVNAAHAVRAFRVDRDGSLTPVGGAAGLPAGTVGLAAR